MNAVAPATIPLSPDGRELDHLVPPPGRRFLLGISGAPGAGKSTLAAAVAAAYDGVVVPLDGFHLADVELERARAARPQGRARRPSTRTGTPRCSRGCGSTPDHVVMAPTFERDLEQPLAGAIPVPPQASLVVTEGNYLLLEDGAVAGRSGPARRGLARRHRRRAAPASGWSRGTSGSARRPSRHAPGWSGSTARTLVLVEAAAHRADVVLDLSAWAPPQTPPESGR